MDELEPHPAYEFFAPGLQPGYACNPNNTNGYIEADVPLLEELGEPLGAEVNKPMVNPMIDKIAEPVAAPVVIEEVNEEWLMTPVTPPSMPVMPLPSTYEVGGPSIVAAEGHSLTLSTPGVPVSPSVIEDLCTRMGYLEHGHGLLVKKVIKVSDAEAADSIIIREIGPRVSTMEGQGQQAATKRDEVIFGLSQQVQTLQAAIQHRDVQIQQLQTMVAEMSSRESILMQCLLGMDRRFADLERRPLGPQ
ncbi:hypothetical protein Tco_1476781 [Tanacetum coccineum]